MLRGDWIRASIGVSVFVSESICCKRVLFECVNWKKSSLHFHLFECLLLICFGIVCNIFSQLLCFLFVSVALNDAYSVVILVLFHQLCFLYYFLLFGSYKNLLQIPCRSQEKRKFTMILLVCLPFSSQPFRAVFNFPHFYIDILLGDYLFSYPSYFFQFKIRKQDGFVSVWFRLFAFLWCIKRLWNAKKTNLLVVTLSSIWNRN